MLGIVLIGLPILVSLAMLAMAHFQRLVCLLGVALIAAQAIILVNLPSQAQVPGLGLVLSVSGLSTILLLGMYGGLAVQFIYAVSMPQGNSFHTLLLIVNAAVTAAVLLSRQLAVAGLILAAVLALIAYTVNGHEKSWNTLDATLKMLIAATLAAVAFLASTLLIDAYNSMHDPNIVRVLAALLSVGMGIIIGVFPLSLWLPKLGEVAPSMVTVWLVGLVSGAALTIMVTSAEVYPWLYSVERANEFLRWAGAAAAIVTAYLTWTSARITRLVIYAAASNVSIGVVGLASASATGLIGLSYLILNHVLATSLLLMAVGLLRARGPEFSEVGQARGFDAATLGLLVGGMALAGVPPFGGFTGRWLIFQTAVPHGVVLEGALVAASALVALAFVRCIPFRRHSSVEENRTISHSWPTAGIAALTVAVLALGVFPGPLLTMIDATIASFPGMG